MARKKSDLKNVQKEVLADYSSGGTLAANYTGRDFAPFFDNSNRLKRETILEAKRDAEIRAAIVLLREAVFSEGMHLTPAVNEDSKEFSKAEEIRDFCQTAAAQMDLSLKDYASDMFVDAFFEGTSIAKINGIFAKLEGSEIPKVVLDSLTQYELNEVSFAEDKVNNIVGIQLSGTTRINYDKIIPREAFVVLTLERNKKSPYGITQIIAAIPPLCSKLTTLKQRAEFQKTSAIPIKVGLTEIKKGDEFVKDSAGVVVINPKTGKELRKIELFQEALSDLINNSVFVGTHGENKETTINQLEVSGDGTVFEKSLNYDDGAIRRAILLQKLATGTAENGSRAASDSQAKNILNRLIAGYRKTIGDCFKRELFTLIVTLNFGAEFRHLTPNVDLGSVEIAGWAEKLAAYVSAGYKLDQSQFEGIDSELRTPQRAENWQENGKTENGT